MATDVAQAGIDVPAGPAGPEEDPSARSGFSLSRKKLKVIVLLLAVMGVQVAVGYMLLPDPAVSKPNDPDNPPDPAAELGTDIETVEVDLGTFNPTNGIGGSIIHVSFKLTAIVATGQAQAFQTAVRDTHEARIRAAVVKVVRSSSLEDLNDPDADVMKRKIREEINKVLQKSYVIEVVMGDIRLMPQ